MDEHSDIRDDDFLSHSRPNQIGKYVQYVPVFPFDRELLLSLFTRTSNLQRPPVELPLKV